MQNVDSAIETTLTTKSYLQTINRAKELGYKINLLFFWLDNVELAIERVKVRVSEGGHHIPEEVIRRRYFKGIKNLKVFIKQVDYWLAIDNSGGLKNYIAEGDLNNEFSIFDIDKWRKISS